MIRKKLALAIVTGAVLTGCAHPITPVADESMAYREQGLNATAISAGACDDVWQYIPAANQTERLRLEASAAPTH